MSAVALTLVGAVAGGVAGGVAGVAGTFWSAGRVDIRAQLVQNRRNVVVAARNHVQAIADWPTTFAINRAASTDWVYPQDGFLDATRLTGSVLAAARSLTLAHQRRRVRRSLVDLVGEAIVLHTEQAGDLQSQVRHQAWFATLSDAQQADLRLQPEGTMFAYIRAWNGGNDSAQRERLREVCDQLVRRMPTRYLF